jgi:hypothetical protein
MALFHTHVAGRVHPHGHEPAGQDPHPGDPQDVPEAGDHVGEGAGLRDHLGTSTTAKLVARARKISWRLRTSRPARSGMATEKATTQILADRSSEPAVRNGCTR